MSRQLVLAHFSIRAASFAARAEAAAAAGFDGFGMYVGDWSEQRRAGRSDAELLGILAEHGTRVVEIEALPLFADEVLDTFVHLVATYRPDRVQVVPPFTGAVDRRAAGEWLARIGDRVAPFGCSLALEFLPFTDVADVVAAAEVVDVAARPNVGICVDAWHVFRGAGLLSLVGLDPAIVSCVQLNDGPLEPVLDDYLLDCLHHREPPGEGEFDLRGFMALTPALAPVSVEVPDDDLDVRSPLEVARLLFDEASRYL
ncbi:MAG: sugar phosphate isomerase/epimerase [Acidimicrobiales bacterium]|nr:sugar phosphate isomerase/epimerase [Acidimicrobiales bacterium]MCB9392389.1 sugar phosphate isomerase/epimerase [Acidimicrobiaceae bacterium]